MFFIILYISSQFDMLLKVASIRLKTHPKMFDSSLIRATFDFFMIFACDVIERHWNGLWVRTSNERTNEEEEHFQCLLVLVQVVSSANPGSWFNYAYGQSNRDGTGVVSISPPNIESMISDVNYIDVITLDCRWFSFFRFMWDCAGENPQYENIYIDCKQI